jgi:hypothetical protein
LLTVRIVFSLLAEFDVIYTNWPPSQKGKEKPENPKKSKESLKRRMK